jgi:xanthosine utilization system XapX-like protein
MGNSLQSQQPLHRNGWQRVLLLLAGLILLLLGVVPLFLNALGVVSISPAWVNALEALLAVLGIFVAFGQWVFPSLWHLFSGGPSVVRGGKKAFCKQVKRSIDRFLGKAVLVTFAEDHEVACEVSLVDRRSWVQCPPNARNQLVPLRREVVRSYRVRIGWFRTGCVRAAVFRDLDPGDYVIWFDMNQPIFVAVFPNEVAIADRI